MLPSGHGQFLLSKLASVVDVGAQPCHLLKCFILSELVREAKRAHLNYLRWFVVTMARQPCLETHVSTKAQATVSAIMSGVGVASGQRV